MSEGRNSVHESSLREAIVSLLAWLVLGIYTVWYCVANGYGRQPEEIDTTWGIPNWVLYGVFAPWIVANLFTWWYSFRFVKDCDLGADEAGSSET